LAAIALLSIGFAQPIPSYQALKFPPLKPITLPEPVTFELPNGLKVYLLENHELPLVRGTALVRTGNLFDDPNRRGTADITGTVMRSGGAGGRTGEQLDVELENIAASVESEIGETSASVSFSALTENTDQVLAIFKDVLTAPAFPQDKIDLAKTQYRSGIARRNDDPSGIAGREFAGILYGKNTPYGWDIEYDNIDAINRFDVSGFYNRYFYPANIMLAVYGDFSAAAMRAKIEKLLGGWKYGPFPKKEFPPVAAKPEPGIYLAEKDDVTQTFFEIGHLGGQLRDPDLPALTVAADILGGGFSSRLVKRVRTALGYAYDISAGWGANFDHPGLFTISGSTQSKYTEATLKVIREEVDKMRAEPVSADELKTAKDSVLNSFVFQFDKPSKTLVRLLTYDYFGYPRDFIFDYQKRIAAVTKEDVLRATRQYWHPDAFTIVAAGNPKDFGTPLSALGLPVHKIDLTIPEPKPKPGEEKPTPAQIQKGGELLGRLQTALGGAGNLEKVKDVQISLHGEIETGPNQSMKVTQKNFFLPPLFRQEIELPYGKQTVFSDGQTGWLATGQSVKPMPPAVIDQARGQLFRELISLSLSDRDSKRTIAAKGDQSIAIAGEQGQRVTVRLEATTGLPATLTYVTGSGREIEESFSDWRPVEALKLPFQTIIDQAGKKFAVMVVDSYRINGGLQAGDLSKTP
jgi:zinc protease